MTTWKNTFWFCPILLCLCCVQGFGQFQADTNLYYVLGKEWRDSAGQLLGQAYEYYVKSDQLNSATSWDPETTKFPLSLNAEAIRGRSILSADSKTTNEITLNDVSIKRLNVTKALAKAQDKQPSDFSNQWVVSFTFIIQSTPSVLRHVVMFLDGSLAIEKVKDMYSTKREAGVFRKPGQIQGSPSRDLGNDNKSKPTATEVDPLAQLRLKNLTLAQIQWNPFREPLPMDLNSQADRARTVLLNQGTAVAGPLLLDEIYLNGFMPSLAIEAQGLDHLANRFHWFLIFRYLEQHDPTKTRTYHVYMLLDGRILGTNVSVARRVH